MYGQIFNLRAAARCRVKETHTEDNARGSEVGSEFSIGIVAFSGKNRGHILWGSFPSGKRRRRHDAARVTDFPAAAPYRGAGGAAAAVQPHQVRFST